MNSSLKLIAMTGLAMTTRMAGSAVAADVQSTDVGAATAAPSATGDRIEADTYSDFTALILAFRERRQDFLQARLQLRHDLALATSVDERQQLLQAFADQYRDIIVQQRELRREFRMIHQDIRRQRRQLGM